LRRYKSCLTSALSGMIAQVDGMEPAGARNARGVCLIATGVDWVYGGGPEVTGPGEVLLMAMAARPDPLNQLTGPGKMLLAQRI
jgi:hypothetical protein